MIFEAVLRQYDDLASRLADFTRAAQGLLAALPISRFAERGLVQAWLTATGNAVAGLGTRAGLEGFPDLTSLLAQLTTPAGNGRFDRVEVQISAIEGTAVRPPQDLLNKLIADPDRAIAASAELALVHLRALRALIDEALQQAIESADTNNNSARYNLGGIHSGVRDLGTFPVLTQELGYGGSTKPGGGAGSAGGSKLSNRVHRAITEVLGRPPRLGDPRSFAAALQQSFNVTERAGQTYVTWNPHGPIGQSDLGGTLSGAQASLYQRAKAAIDEVMPLIERIRPLRPDFDPQDTDAVRSIVRTELSELVTELGYEGGPRVPRVDQLFEVILGARANQIPRISANILGTNIPPPPNTGGEIQRLGDTFGLSRRFVQTLEEEKVLTDFLVVADHLEALFQSWTTFRNAFVSQTDNFLGTQLVLIQRSLGVAAESAVEVAFAMDSVFLGPAERQAVRIDFPAAVSEQPMFVQDLLGWIETFAVEEAPAIIQGGGKQGVFRVAPTLRRLSDLVAASVGRIRHPAGRHPRVVNALGELAGHLGESARLAGSVQ
jgi:hypothetical protein